MVTKTHIPIQFDVVDEGEVVADPKVAIAVSPRLVMKKIMQYNEGVGDDDGDNDGDDGDTDGDDAD